MDGLPQLPRRAGPRPRTTTEIPHTQLDQQPDDPRYVDAILAEALTWPSVLAGPSVISVEGARALMLNGREFCHVHAQGDFSLHAALPLPLAAAAEHAGWAEPHVLARTGQAPANIVMIYAPRDSAEQDMVLGLVRAAYELHSSNHQPYSGSFESPAAKENAMSIFVVGPNDGEQSGGGPIRCRIIEDGTHTQHRLGLIEAIVPPVPGGPPQHIHRDHDETFIVTEGKLTFTSGADSVDVEAGSCITVPAGTPHTFANPFGEAAKFICTLTPDVYVEYFRELGKLPVDELGLLDPADVGRTMAAYATEVIR